MNDLLKTILWGIKPVAILLVVVGAIALLVKFLSYLLGSTLIFAYLLIMGFLAFFFVVYQFGRIRRMQAGDLD